MRWGKRRGFVEEKKTKSEKGEDEDKEVKEKAKDSLGRVERGKE